MGGASAPPNFFFFSFILYRPVFLKSGQLITGQTGLIYKGKDGTGRIIKPDEYQPKGSYAAANHNHSGVYQPVGSYAAANHSHNGTNLSYNNTLSINDAINNNYSMILTRVKVTGWDGTNLYLATG